MEVQLTAPTPDLIFAEASATAASVIVALTVAAGEAAAVVSSWAGPRDRQLH